MENKKTSPELTKAITTIMDMKSNRTKEQEALYGGVARDALAEVLRAKTLFPERFVNQHEGIAVLWEEVDELWDEVKKNQRNYDLAAQRKEAIQVAAMAIRFAAELT